MKSLLIYVLFVGYVLCRTGSCLAHGAHCMPIDGAMAVEAAYHDGSPMAFCDVEVFRPSEDEPCQTGLTDAFGRFAFVPDTTGTWSVAVDDGMGHRATAEVAVGTQGMHEHTHGGIPGTTRGLILGLSVILALFGLISLVYAWRRRAR